MTGKVESVEVEVLSTNHDKENFFTLIPMVISDGKTTTINYIPTWNQIEKIRLDNKIDDLYNDRDITEREITRLEGTIKGIESKRESVYPKEEIYQETRSRYQELREELEGKALQEGTAAMEHTKESPRMSGMHR